MRFVLPTRAFSGNEGERWIDQLKCTSQKPYIEATDKIAFGYFNQLDQLLKLKSSGKVKMI